MSMIMICDKCGKPIEEESRLGATGDDGWLQAAVAIGKSVREGRTKDYHRACARTITLAEVWKRPNLVDL